MLISVLLHLERLAVGTLIHSRVGLVSAHSDAVKAAIVAVAAVMCAARYRTFYTLVCAFCAHTYLSVQKYSRYVRSIIMCRYLAKMQ